MALRLALAIVAALVAASNAATVAAQDPGHVGEASISLREAPGAPNGVEVVLRWGPANPGADYEIWRRTPWDLTFQETEKYADVPASAALPDGTFEFVDPDPFGMPEWPCYVIGATLGEPPRSFAVAGCIPTLPSAMPGLVISAFPGPNPDSWYVSGSGFAPGVRITLQELTCPAAPCDGPPLSVATQITATIDGRFSTYTRLTTARGGAPRTIVAYEPGWLPTQFPQAPTVEVPASHGGAALGYPLSVRTNVPEVDRALAALQSLDPAQVAALFVPREFAAPSDGQPVLGLPIVTCGNGDTIALASLGFGHVAQDVLNGRIYAVFRVAPAEDQWAAYEGASHAIVLVGQNEAGFPIGTMVAVDEQGIVGAGRRCGAPPTYYLRDVAEYLLAPLTGPEPAPAPGPPATGTGRLAEPVNEHATPGLAVLVVLMAAGAAGHIWLTRRRPGR